ncbi:MULTISPECIES: hypothetical protein [Enterobacter cloacae complex]|uniref:hypothetical protein n=1 Tax=Enterobacter cloacae complex TaxID=354276 RepID=UPI000FEB8DFC|nr:MULTISPECIES: hypothetical protein [Enterobacter cloacae complex]MBY6353795.1 hypothetical protein [Enterobacter sichuanensis]
MQRFVDSIRKAIRDHNWYGAIFVALTMPDICSAIENPYEARVGVRYRDWFNRYLREKYKYKYVEFTAEDCYQFRCKCLHQGIARRDGFEKFHLSQTSSGSVIHMNSFDGVIQIQVSKFCEDICQSVEQWMLDMKPNPAITLRMQELLEIHFYN